MEKNVFPSRPTTRRQRKTDKQEGSFSREHVSRRRFNHLVLRQRRRDHACSIQRAFHAPGDRVISVQIFCLMCEERRFVIERRGARSSPLWVFTNSKGFPRSLRWPLCSFFIERREVRQWSVPVKSFPDSFYLLSLSILSLTCCTVLEPPSKLILLSWFFFIAFSFTRQSMLTEQLFFFEGKSKQLCFIPSQNI